MRDEGALANAVRSFFEDEKLPKGDVRIGLSSNRIGVRTLDIEGVEDESRFDNAVRFKAHEVLPVALSESVLDYRVLEERVGEDGVKSRRVLLVVAPRDQVEPYTRVANLAGIRLEALDLEALGLLRAFVEPGTGARTPDDTASVVVSIGHESSTLLVAGGGACEFTRVFDWGGSALEEASRLLARRPAGRSGHDSPAPVPLGPGPAVRDPRRGDGGRRQPMPSVSVSPRSHGSSSTRSSSTRPRPSRSASAGSRSPAARRISRASTTRSIR